MTDTTTSNQSETKQLVSQAEFSRILGCARSYVTLLKGNDRLVMVGHQVDVQASIAKIDSTGDPNRGSVLAQQASQAKKPQVNVLEQSTASVMLEQGSIANEGNASYQESRAVKEKYLALQAKAAYERNIGTLVDADGVRRLGYAMGSHLRTALENLQDQLAAELAVENNQDRIYAMLGDEFARVLDEISRTLAKGLEVQDE